MEEEIMLCTDADVRDTDHGSAAIIIELSSKSSGQAFVCKPSKAYELLVLFQVERLSDCKNKPIVVCRKDPYGTITSLKRLPCYEPGVVNA